MSHRKSESLPRYRGCNWLSVELPTEVEDWPAGGKHSIGHDGSSRSGLKRQLGQALGHAQWQWPKRPLAFFSDLHADADAFSASLVASGAMRKTGPRDEDFKLTREARHMRLLIGGDNFDKGPSTLRLLRLIQRLRERGADLQLLAGNHDIRMMLGIRAIGLEPDPRTDHFFIRMGPKMVPFMAEIRDQYLHRRGALHGLPGKRECRRLLYPPKRWFDEFPKVARWGLPESVIEKEMQRIEKKTAQFEQQCERAGLSLRMVYAAALKWQQLFLQRKGEFSWFYRHMRLAKREGSFLFLHAGLDDRGARLLRDEGVSGFNRQFRRQLKRDLFDFYYGPLANSIRTKYREQDMPLTRHGIKRLRQAGIHCIVHGHHNQLAGQRIMLRKGMLNIQCDATVDRGSRAKEGLKGHGAAVTLIQPQRRILGICSDYPRIKLFEPARYAGHQ